MVKIFLLPEKYRDRSAYHPVDYMKKVLEKESKNFNYLAGYRKPKNNITFEDRSVDISKFVKKPFKNSSISRQINNRKGIFKTELTRMSTIESPRLESRMARNDLDKCKY